MAFLQIYGIGVLVILGLMTALWIVSLILRNSSIVDIFRGTGFVIANWVYFALTPDGFPARKWLIVTLVTVWGLRLSLYILWRNWGKGEDFRYRKWREEAGGEWWWRSFFKVFLLQGLLLWIISAPLLAAQVSATPARLTIAQRGREVLLGRGPYERWLKRFLLSAYQAALFNTWLTERIRRGWFERLLTGDIAKKTDTGGLFEVMDAEVELPRFQRREITYTGPIYGARMRWANGEPGELERMVLETAEVTAEMLRRARLDGSRRPARLFLTDLSIEPHPDGLLFTFTLLKGAYATTVLREFMKTEVTLPEE